MSSPFETDSSDAAMVASRGRWGGGLGLVSEKAAGNGTLGKPQSDPIEHVGSS
jgi:hypothetical protein